MKPPVLAGIGLGANLGHPIEAVRKAMQSLENLPETTLTAASRLYRTPAWGRTDQPDFINAAVLVQTRLSPQTLLSHLLAIERAASPQFRSADHTASASLADDRAGDVQLQTQDQQRR